MMNIIMPSLPPPLRFAIAVLAVYVALPLYLGYLLLGGTKGCLATLVGMLTALYWYGDLPRRSVAHLPGPKPLWLFGHLSKFKTHGYHIFYGHVTHQYGPVAAVMMGNTPQVIIADPDLIKEVCLSDFDVFQDRQPRFMLRQSKGLLTLRGAHWQASRRALNPAFNSIKLAAFADIISDHCHVLVERLGRVVDQGGGQPIDVLRLFGDLTLDVIGSTSFDSDFQLQKADPPVLTEDTEKDASNCTNGTKQHEPTPRKRRTARDKASHGTTTPDSGSSDEVAQAARFIFANLAGPLGGGSPMQIFVSVVLPFLGPLFRIMYPFLQTPESMQFIESIRTLDKLTLGLLEGRSRYSTTTNNDNDNDNKSTNPSSTPRRRSDGQPIANFIDLIRKARDPDSGIGLDHDECRDQLNLFVLAGYETTANTLAYVAFLLAQNPKAEERLVEEIKRLAPDRTTKLTFKELADFTYTHAIVNEALRLYPPGAMLSRQAQRDVYLGKSNPKDKQYYIPKGTAVVIPVYSIHRDERFWKNPEAFDPERFLPERASEHTKYTHLPFGLGPRNCIGQRFALEEAKLAIIALYREYTLKLHKHTTVPLKLRAGITLSPEEGIWMTVHRR